jgi:2-polyprenyl-3-methyl-5-hydroxy-6-metoxy-1,4-benzoquinol methylase
LNAGLSRCSVEEFEQIVTALDGGVPDAAEYQRMTTLVLDTPGTRRLGALDPFSPEYHQAVLELYLGLRSRRDDGYVPERDEAPSAPVPEHVWSQLSPWGFRDLAMVGEHLYAWGHILRHLALRPAGSVLEYGPGSGQLLLMLARMGFRACGVDVDAVALEGIRLQAEGMGLQVPVERARFGEGFGDERFDGIIFYEAFHHALDFQQLLRRLHDRLTPGGRVVLCGEPVVPAEFPGIPYPWGPRLDALSVFCMRRFGWMELGFTHAFFVESARRAGWGVGFHPFPGCGRAHVYVLERRDVTQPEIASPPPAPVEADPALALAWTRAELAAVHASTSWRLTRPLRLAGRLLGRG